MRPVLLCILLVCGSATSTSAQQLKEFTNSIGMKLVLIHAGSFTMGSRESDEARKNDETAHEVTISKSYYLGAYEVTQEQYEKVMGNNPSQFKNRKNPAENVSWEDAVLFCKKLSAIPEEMAVGREYRLPTEAEWEYACRAGSDAEYYFGKDRDTLGMYAWYEENSGGETHPVGEKKPNAWGLYDMHGKVWELCNDWDDAYTADRELDPQGPEKGPNEYRVARGGSWRNHDIDCRSVTRGGSQSSHRHNFFGFRIVLTLKKMTELRSR